MEDVNFNGGHEQQLLLQISNGEGNEGAQEEEARMEIAGCTGKKQAQKQGEEESYRGRTSFFFNYVTFIF